MAKIIVLGAGRVGRVIARDLHEDPHLEVTVADVQAETLDTLGARHGFATVTADLASPARVSELVGGYDLAVGALPGALGLQTLEAVLKAGVPRYVDISFMSEDPRSLSERAAAAGQVVLYDIGVAPGMSNVLLAQAVRQVGSATFARYLVGGLPVARRWPWEYEAPFSPIDVVEEYTRPARFVSGGQVRTRPALSDPELFHFPELGTLEGFLTDGLRSMLDTIDCPHIEEKTLRYPGHADRIRVLRDSGFFEDRELRLGAASVNVREFTFALLDPLWHQAEGSAEFTVMRIEVQGESGARVVWDLLDRTDPERGESSMARTTGFPAAICARRLLSGQSPLGPGIHPPEALAADDGFVLDLLAALAERRVCYQRSEA